MRALGLMVFAKRVTAQSDALPIHTICWPQGSTYEQGAKVIDIFIQTHPQFLNYSMRDLVAAALIQAFPCQ